MCRKYQSARKEEVEEITLRPKRSHKTPSNYNPQTGKSYAHRNVKTTGVVKAKVFKSTREFLKDAKLRRDAFHNLISEDIDKKRVDEYGSIMAKVIARTIGSLRKHIVHSSSCHAQQFILKKGLKLFVNKGKSEAMAKLLQQHQCMCFEPIHVHEMTKSERRCAVISLMLFADKLDGRVKVLQVYNGKPTRKWVSQENKSSPTVIN